MLLLDTNHCFRIIARDAGLLKRLNGLRAERVITSVIVAGELLYGASISERQAENVTAVTEFLDAILVVPLSARISRRYADIKASLLTTFGPRERAKRRGFDLLKLGFGDNDLWIAATALERDAILVSADPDFRRIAAVAGLRVDNWLAG